ncbi:MAG: flippase-like domain-containing protein [Elusimicrobia bacterium]|nr:flippase-like domain-containing protein [Elusimicrobiota bacterium]MDE2236575.1 flippase-like domain-containing protein [Elusimicrobiota bacterium]MDE2424346.1 flippase-like domain-containing protein [Elusimicrobiota bacterium]
MKRRAASTIAAAAVTIVLSALAVRNVHLAGLEAMLAGVLWRWIAVIALLSLLDLAIRAKRWQVLLSRSGARPKALELFKLEAIGLAVNNVLFLRLGELARAFLAARDLDIAAATALASVAVERALDIAALLFFFILASFWQPQFVPSSAQRIALLALAAAVAALAALAAAEGSLRAGGWCETALRRWPKAHRLIVQLADGAAVLRSARQAAAAVALSLALWGADALIYWAGALALGLGAAIDYPRSVLVLSWAGAGAALPAAPGGFGTLEAMVKTIVVAFGVSPDAALAYALFCHMAMYIIVTVLGLVFLYQVGLSLGELRAALGRKERA